MIITNDEVGVAKSNVIDKKKVLFGWIKFLIIVVGVFIVFRFGVGLTMISGNSMAPTFQDRNLVLSNNLLYDLDRNDIIIFRDDYGFDVIKRIAAVPGDTVEIINGVVFINDQPLDMSHTKGTPLDKAKTIVEDQSYFVLGDNLEPGASLDSRSEELGTIPQGKVKGKVVISLWPFKWMD